MSKANAWIAALIVTGGLCVSAAVVKHVTTPPPSLPYVTPPPSATGDPNPADAKAWDDLTILIDTEQCDQASLETLGVQTYWYQVLKDDHIRTDADIETDRAAIAEYQKMGADILADQQNRAKQGMSIIERMKDGSRSKTMSRFVNIEHALAEEEARRENAQKDELDTLEQLLDVAAIREERKTTAAADKAKWNTLIGTLMRQQDAYNKTRDDTIANTRTEYDRLGRLVGRIPNYSYSRTVRHSVMCEAGMIHAFGLADVERQAQQILAR